jgi:hypothetical protein
MNIECVRAGIISPRLHRKATGCGYSSLVMPILSIWAEIGTQLETALQSSLQQVKNFVSLS